MKRRNRTRSPRTTAVVSTPAPGAFSAGAIMLAPILIAAATAAAYCNSLAGPLIFDDQTWIEKNPTIRHLWPIGSVLFPPNAENIGGRPVVSLTLAINYALGGMDVGGYHAMNLAIHVLAAWLVFGVVRRTLILPRFGKRFASVAGPLALTTAILWAIHPLQTEAVTYIIQRTEALMGLFYLLTLYCFIRGASVEGSGIRGRGAGPDIHHSSFITQHSPTLWYLASVLACLLGMATKEVMATAPVIVLLYDRTFLAGSFREAWRRRYGLYLALAATWGVVAALLFSTGFYGGTTGFAVEKFTWSSYLLTQSGVLVHYLRLVFWPTGLCFDYGWPPAKTVGEIVLPGMVVLSLLGLTLWALVKRPAWGFLGAWFFVILAPSSSLVPITDAAFEHRMYLSLAGLAAGLVMGGWMILDRLARAGKISRLASQSIGVVLAMLVGAALGVLTFERNEDYRSDLSIWENTVAKAPDNERVRNNLGYALATRGEIEEAVAEYHRSLQINPNYDRAHYNLGVALLGRRETDEAIAHFQKALQINPSYAEALNNLGLILADRGLLDEAIARFQTALEIDPSYAETHNNLANAMAILGRFDEAIPHYQKALEIDRDHESIRQNLGLAAAQREEMRKTLAEKRELLRARPDDLALLNETAWMLATNPNASLRNGAEAVKLAQRAVQLTDAREPVVLGTLAAAYAEASRFPEAVQTARKALDLATQQNKQPLVESIKAKISLYEAGTPFRAMPQFPAAGSVQP